MKKIFLLSGLLLLFSYCKHPESEKINQHNVYVPYQFNEESNQNTSFYNDSEENILDMENENGVKYVWIEINGLKLRFIFDTGASNICISAAEATVLLKQGTLQEEDILGVEHFQDATGAVSEGMRINLRTVKIGNTLLQNVEAIVVGNNKAPLLLGQSAFEQFSRIEIDNENQRIIFR